ncbi:hypothetical protein ACTMTI_35810 [Nonomuraea sp. H19]|uniref:hypothetical protein n=1 Tax=Nonomuraea sp. H19 TaxID=3452206 RepID=UPI003F8BA8AB
MHTIEARVAELERTDARFQPGQQHTLDWDRLGRTHRAPHRRHRRRRPGHPPQHRPGRPPAPGHRARQAATMLGKLETTPPAEIPTDVTGYTAREIWTGAAGIIGGPLVTSYASLAKQLHRNHAIADSQTGG